jgi:hypothetical protein
MGTKYKPRHGFTDDEIQILALRWGMMKRSGYTVEFESFDAFIRYAKGKFDYGLTMERIDKHKGWFPENISWYNPQKREADLSNRRQQAVRWEKMMQPLRKKYAKQLAKIKPCEREFFRYEHPDLVREGIVFESSHSL